MVLSDSLANHLISNWYCSELIFVEYPKLSHRSSLIIDLLGTYVDFCQLNTPLFSSDDTCPFSGGNALPHSLWLWESSNHSMQTAGQRGEYCDPGIVIVIARSNCHCNCQKLGIWPKKVHQYFSLGFFLGGGIMAIQKSCLSGKKKKRNKYLALPPYDGSPSVIENKTKTKEEHIWVSFGRFYGKFPMSYNLSNLWS